MDKVLAIIQQKKGQKEFVAKIFDDFNNIKKYAVNEATYKFKISNSISFQEGDLLLIEVEKLIDGVIVGVAKKYQSTRDCDTIIWKE